MDKKYPVIFFRLKPEYHNQLKEMLNGDSDKINIKARELLIQLLESGPFEEQLWKLITSEVGRQELKEIMKQIENTETT
jgi:hypothetical protein